MCVCVCVISMIYLSMTCYISGEMIEDMNMRHECQIL